MLWRHSGISRISGANVCGGHSDFSSIFRLYLYVGTQSGSCARLVVDDKNGKLSDKRTWWQIFTEGLTAVERSLLVKSGSFSLWNSVRQNYFIFCGFGQVNIDRFGDVPDARKYFYVTQTSLGSQGLKLTENKTIISDWVPLPFSQRKWASFGQEGPFYCLARLCNQSFFVKCVPFLRFLGTRPVKLFLIQIRGEPAVLALSSRSWVTYCFQGRLLQVPLSYLQLEYGSCFKSELCPEGIVAISDNTLRYPFSVNLNLSMGEFEL